MHFQIKSILGKDSEYLNIMSVFPIGSCQVTPYQSLLCTLNFFLICHHDVNLASKLVSLGIVSYYYYVTAHREIFPTLESLFIY